MILSSAPRHDKQYQHQDMTNNISTKTWQTISAPRHD